MKTKNRKTLTAVLAVVLVAAIAAGATLAFLADRTNTENNVFTFVDNIKGLLTEPLWDPAEALNLTPGKTIDKDPQITNISENGVVEYAAIKLTFLNGAGDVISDVLQEGKSETDMQYLLRLIEIEWGGSWELVDGDADSAEQIYVFKYTLPQGVTTDPLFYSVTILEANTVADMAWLRGSYGHDDDCYEFGDCDCTVTWRHHEKCAIFGEDGAENIAKDGELDEVGFCDCTPAEVHAPRCPSLIKTLKMTETDDDPPELVLACGHTTVVSGLGNFIIKIEGAVVQEDAFADYMEASVALIALFV